MRTSYPVPGGSNLLPPRCDAVVFQTDDFEDLEEFSEDPELDEDE